jgi:hypothetical protein
MDGSGGPVQFETVIGGEPVPAHSDAVVEVHERILGASPARSRHIQVRSGRRVHVIEAGEGPPVLFLHGGSTSSLSLLSLLERLEGVRAIAVDRPGFGLSEPVHVPRERYRDAAIEFLDEVLDELKLETSALAGSSGVGPGPSGMPSRAPNAFVSSCCWGGPPPTRHPYHGALTSDGRTGGRRPAGARETQRDDGRSVHVVGGREGHHRPLPGSDRGARRGRQRPDLASRVRNGPTWERVLAPPGEVWDRFCERVLAPPWRRSAWAGGRLKCGGAGGVVSRAGGAGWRGRAG